VRLFRNGGQLNNNEPLRLSFALTRIQRALNPCERNLYALLGISLFIIGFGAIIRFPGLHGLLMGAVPMVPAYLVFRKHMRALYLALIGNEYINTVEIGKDEIRAGLNGLQLKMSRKSLKVMQGSGGVSVIRHVWGFAIAVPQEAISYTELKRIIENP
jgi:hypothetical protein